MPETGPLNVPELDEEVDAVRWLCRRFAEEKLRAVADEAEAAGTFPRHVVNDLAEMGLLGLGFPEDVGGSGGSHLAFCVAIEEVYRVSPGIAASAFMSPLVAYDLLHGGQAGHCDRHVPRILSGETVAALAVTEPDAGSDVASIRTRATRVDGGWRIDGQKTYITNAGIADVMVVLTTTADEPERGFTAFLVELPSDGVHVESHLDKLGWRASETNALTLDGCRVSDDAVVGEVGRGFELIMTGFNLERATLAAGSVGLAQGAVDEAIAYCAVREQFGGPISELQAVRHRVARAAADVEAARRLTYHAARLVGQGRPGAGAASMAKLVAGEMCQDVSRSMLQVFGGAGFMKEFRIERYFRDSMIMTIGGGTSEIQAEIISKELGLRPSREPMRTR